ncbi:hypothetical protein VH567_00225 [Sphingomonas sp. 4RDLI-65]|uniref:hypothetical protein n=1 Tax=Sphingomonas sp. 4RDLI-65 TaxID=3111641 RepID=UPI003C268C41
MSDPGWPSNAEDAAIDQRERDLVAERRAVWGAAGGAASAPPIGLALSGGGIRSATFSLGVLRELSALGALTRFDYLATVSGGTYVGAFLGGLFVARRTGTAIIAPSQSPPASGDADPLGTTDAHKAIRLLRQSGRYLAPSGTVDYWYALAILIRNWIGLHLVLGSIVFGLALAGVWLRAAVAHGHVIVAAGGSAGGTADTLSKVVAYVPDIGVLPSLTILMFAIATAFGWAYWLTRRDIGGGLANAGGAVAASVVIVLLCLWDSASLQSPASLKSLVAYIDAAPIARSIGAIGLVALATWLFGSVRAMRRGDGRDLEQAWDAQRLWITRRQSTLLQIAAALAAFALADRAAFALAGWIAKDGNGWKLAASPVLVTGLVTAARTLLSRTAMLGTFARGPFAKLANRLLIPGLATALTLSVVAFWGTLAYVVTWPFAADQAGSLGRIPLLNAFLSRGGVISADVAIPSPALVWLKNLATARPLVIATIVALVAALGIRKTVSFLNLSSLATFYAGRLRRAYLGAGNRARFGAGIAIEIGDSGDDIDLAAYFPHRSSGAPLHLISVTLNQTRGRGSNIVQHDRHGRNMTLGPAGISVSLDDGARSLIPYDSATTQVERLPLSAWIGISGASFSTGIGARTGFGLTTLAGLANVRLGYWWRAGDPKTDQSVQSYLLDEIRGRFAGTDTRRWYLSDGGHFDNSAVYELIRRRLPFILASDNGQDERYGYEDLATLVRKARIDFGAEISFLDAPALDAALGVALEANARPVTSPASRPGTASGTPQSPGEDNLVRRAFGTLRQIGGDEPAAPHAVAALATIRYHDGSMGTLVLMKPRLTGDGPADLVRYKSDNVNFPQQATIDQFFDEAQWESYYTLGRLVTRLVMAPRDGRWSPGELVPLGAV